MVAAWVAPSITGNLPLVLLSNPSTASVSTWVLVKDRSVALHAKPNDCGFASPTAEWRAYHSDGLIPGEIDKVSARRHRDR
jgi:hypothetical protein